MTCANNSCFEKSTPLVVGALEREQGRWNGHLMR